MKLPITRYYGSKRKLITKIWDIIEHENLQFNSVLDLFGGSGVFSYYAKQKNKLVTYNDIFRFNTFIGKALIETNQFTLEKKNLMALFKKHDEFKYNSYISDNYSGIYYTDEENHLIDIITQNIEFTIKDDLEKACAYYILFQSCMIKRPFNIFHRKNLNLRLNHTKSNFGNYRTWEKEFELLFCTFYEELKGLIFSNGHNNIAVNNNALCCNETADLVYIDPPYFSKSSSHTTYHSRYHFLEGLAHYDNLISNISDIKNNKEVLINNSCEFERVVSFKTDLRRLLEMHANSIIAISYRNNGRPTIAEIRDILSDYKENIRTFDLGAYNYALNRNNEENREFLIIGV